MGNLPTTIKNNQIHETNVDALKCSPTTPVNQPINSPTLSNISHLSQAPRKENNVRSWFNFSPTSTASGASNTSKTLATDQTKSPNDANTETSTPKPKTNFSEVDSTVASSSQSMNLKTNTNFGEFFLKKKTTEQHAELTQAGIDACGEEQSTLSANSDSYKTQQKPSRRTTSLLNLFTSNTQGNVQ